MKFTFALLSLYYCFGICLASETASADTNVAPEQQQQKRSIISGAPIYGLGSGGVLPAGIPSVLPPSQGYAPSFVAPGPSVISGGSSVGVSTNTNTITTVKQAVPVHIPIDRPVPVPVPIHK